MRIPDINDIMVLPSGHIFIERQGRMQDSGRKMLSNVVSHRIVERIVTSQGRRIDHSSPMVDARVKDGSRLNAIIEPLAVDGPALTIRRFSNKRITLEDLVDKKTIPKNVAQFLSACVAARKNIVISGGTGSGKTTLLNALAAKISPEERIVTVEDTAEMRLLQTHVITLQARPANLEGEGEVTIRKLVRNTLRMRPDRILVGECRGGETLDMLQAMNTGHSGSMTTIHANSAEDAVRRLETMTMEADSKLPSRAIREQISSAVDIIIQITRMKDIRRVISICEVGDFDEDTQGIVVEEIFSWRERRWKKGRFSSGSLEFTGYVPQFFDELLSNGAEMTCLVS
jgi:pilus assembly protein CpaF